MSQSKGTKKATGHRPDYFIQVREVSISEASWKKIRRSRRKAPSLYVIIEYGKEKVRTRTANNCLSPSLEDKQLVVRPSSSDKGTKIRIVVMHDSVSQVDTTIGQMEIKLEDLRSKTIDGKVTLDLMSSPHPSAGTITIHCEPFDYKSLVAETGEEVARIAKRSSHLIEVTRDISSLIARQSNLNESIDNLVMKLDDFVKVIDRSSEIHLYSDAAWRIAKSGEKKEGAVSNQPNAEAEVVDLVDDLTFTMSCILQIEGMKDKFSSLEIVIIQILQQITECCIFVREYMGYGFFERMNLFENYEKIRSFRDVLAKLRGKLDPTMATSTAIVVARMSKQIDIMYIKTQLQPMEYHVSLAAKCDPGTCIEAISNITSLLMSASDSNIVWLFGPSGCGKSMLSLTLAEYFRGIKRLGAYLHFRHGSASPESIIPTIAYQLSTFDSTIGGEISNHAQHYHKGLTMETQFKESLLQPLTEAARSMLGPVIIILDGVDEYGPIEARSAFLELFSSGLFSKLPRNFRFMITSEWDREISLALLSSSNHIHHVQLYPGEDTLMIANAIDLTNKVLPEDIHRDFDTGDYAFHLYSSIINDHYQFDYKKNVLNLAILNNHLNSIITGKNHMHVLNKQIPDLEDLLRTEISPFTKDACLSWSCDLSETPFSEKTLDLLSEFAHKKLLIWIEVMSLMGKYDFIGPALLKAISWISDHDEQLVTFLQNAHDLVVKYAECTSLCAIQVYWSMLLFEKGHSDVADHYQSNISSLLKTEEIGYRPFVGHSGYVSSVTFSADDTRVVSDSVDKTVKVWDSKNGKNLSTLEKTTEWVSTIAFSPDGTRIASNMYDMTVRIWDAKNGKQLLALVGHSHYVRAVSFSPDGKRVVTGSEDKTVRVWNAKNGKLLSVSKGHTLWIGSVAFSADGTRVVSGSGDKTVRIWDTKKGKLLFTLKGHTFWVRSVSFSPDSTRVVSGADDNTVRIWNARNGKLLSTFEGHTDWVTSVAFSTDGTRVVSGSGDKIVRIWDVDRQNLYSKEHLFARELSMNAQSISLSQSMSETRWEMGDDGWVKVEGNDHAIWIPKNLRRYVCRPTDSINNLMKSLGYCLILHVHSQ